VAREGDRHIGAMGLHNIHPRNRWPCSHRRSAKEYRGKGYGTEATQLILKYASTLNLHRVELGVFDFNKAGIAVYEKCGLPRGVDARAHLRQRPVRRSPVLILDRVF
jgi:RimJ/RimL family protein N-acetyltransferase